jgi:adenylate kinase family enzyme
MTLLERYTEELYSYYNNFNGPKDTMIIYGGPSYLELYEVMDNDKRKKSKDKIVNIEHKRAEQLKGPVINFNTFIKDKSLKINDKTGFFKVEYKDGNYITLVKWIDGNGQTLKIETLILGTQENILRFFHKKKTLQTKQDKPKKGFYRITTNMQGVLSYEKVDKVPTTPVIHPAIGDLHQELDFYFNNVERFLKYDRPGVRKSLIIGEPGTGKTSAAMKIAALFQETANVSIATDIPSVAKHMNLAAKNKVKTITILEDAEIAFEATQGADLLNFLDGIDQPRNTAGSYVIMITNHPERIEERIVKRPGRIDKIIDFGALHDEYALKVAEFYFGGLLFEEMNFINGEFNPKSPKVIKKEAPILEELFNIVDGMTGAQIKNLAETAIAESISKNVDITVELVAEIKSDLLNLLNNLNTLAKSDTIDKRNTVGFGKKKNKIRLKGVDVDTKYYI